IGFDEAEQNAERRRLAGAVFAQQRDNHPGRNFQRYVVQCELIAIPLCHFVQTDHGVHVPFPFLSSRASSSSTSVRSSSSSSRLRRASCNTARNRSRIKLTRS